MNNFLRVAMTVAIAFGVYTPLSADEDPLFDDCIACGDVHTAPLIAGGGNAASAINVGQVIVYNCDLGVCVEYVLSDAAIEDGWLITETHVEVADSLGGIPQTKKGNPIPGHFEDIQYFEFGVADYRYCVSFEDIGEEVGPGDIIPIAAHAVVTRPSDSGQWTQVWQIGDVEEETEGLLNNYADEFNWGDPAGPTTAGPNLGADEPAYEDPFIVGTHETSSFPYNSNSNRGYADDFDLEWTGALPWGGLLTVSWSPGQSASERKEVMIDGTGPEVFTALGVNSPGQGWFLDTYPLVTDFMPVSSLEYGTHTINFKHTIGDGTFWDWIRLEQPGLESETAWAAGCDFDGKNWATYICDYEVQGCTLSCPEIVGSEGNVTLLDEPLPDVQAGESTAAYPQVFAEYAGDDHGGFTLDIDSNSTTNIPDGFPVDSNTAVCSYYVHFDDGNGDHDQGLFSLEFEEDVMGLIVAGTTNGSDIFNDASINTLCDTDAALGNAATVYPVPETCGINGDARGLEFFNIDPANLGNQDPLSIDGKTVHFNLNIYNKHDSLRIILPAIYK